MPTTHSQPARPTTIDVTSRTSRHEAMLAADAAFAKGDVALAENVCRRVLAVDCENREALALFVCVLSRQNRHAEAVAVVDGVLAHFRSLQESNTLVHALLQLQRRGFDPRGVLDVGAYHGEFAMFARQMFPGASIVMVEPQAPLQEFLRALAIELRGDCHVRQCVLGETVRPTCDFHVTNTPFGSTGSSLYPERSDFPRQIVTMPMRTVDDLLNEFTGRKFDLVKIDVQGAELDVLRGATERMHHVEVLITELSLHEANHGAPRFTEAMAAIDELGFAMFDMATLPRVDGLLLQVDGIFVRKTSPLWQRGAK